MISVRCAFFGYSYPYGNAAALKAEYGLAGHVSALMTEA
jgi:hypothetical protein